MPHNLGGFLDFANVKIERSSNSSNIVNLYISRNTEGKLLLFGSAHTDPQNVRPGPINSVGQSHQFLISHFTKWRAIGANDISITKLLEAGFFQLLGHAFSSATEKMTNRKGGAMGHHLHEKIWPPTLPHFPVPLEPTVPLVGFTIGQIHCK